MTNKLPNCDHQKMTTTKLTNNIHSSTTKFHRLTIKIHGITTKPHKVTTKSQMDGDY